VRTTLTSTDYDKINLSLQLFHSNINLDRLEAQIRTLRTQGITPKMFTYNLVQQAKAQKRHIVLAEGTEPRILQAATVLIEQDIVDLTLLGQPDEIAMVIKKHGITLDLDRLQIIDPVASPHFESYVQTLYEARKAKGMNLADPLRSEKSQGNEPRYGPGLCSGCLLFWHFNGVSRRC